MPEPPEVTELTKLTLIIDDFDGAEPGFQKAYGFALVIERGETVVLFDTGSHARDLAGNLAAHGLDPGTVSAVILSHNHNDHANGVSCILEANPAVPVFIHIDWDKPHSFKGGRIPAGNRRVVQSPGPQADLPDWVRLTASHAAGDYGGIYEHACWVVTGENAILVTGCAHPGLNCFLEDRSAAGVDEALPVTIIGGFHGTRFSDNRAQDIDPQLATIYCCHCTSHYRRFQRQFEEKCKQLPVGGTLEFA